jgi:predicted nucleic acid-binding protein
MTCLRKLSDDGETWMTERRTYLDANVLIAAWNGDPDTRAWARAVLDDPDRRFVVSDFVRLEVLPKPAFHGRASELAFMEIILSAADSVPVSAALITRALTMAGKHDLHVPSRRIMSLGGATLCSVPGRFWSTSPPGETQGARRATGVV